MSTGTATRPKFKHVKLSNIRTQEGSLRSVKEKDLGFLELVNSIAQVGVQTPIQVVELAEKDPETKEPLYGIVNGLQRYAASLRAGKQEIPCYITDTESGNMLTTQMITNLHVVKMRPAEYAEALKKLSFANPTWTSADIGAKIQKSAQWVDSTLSINDLPAHVKELVNDGKIPVSNAYQLVNLQKASPSEVDDYLERAQTTGQGEFYSLVNARIKQIREEKRKGRDPNKSREYVAAPRPRQTGPIKEVYNARGGAVMTDLLKSMNASTPEEGFLAAIAWVLHMDPNSQEEGRRKFEAERQRAEADKAARAEEKRQQRAKEAQDDLAKAKANVGAES